MPPPIPSLFALQVPVIFSSLLPIPSPLICIVCFLLVSGIKSDFRLGRNFLKGQQGDSINLLLAATAANLSLWMSKILSALVQILSPIPLHSPIPISPALQRAF
jgi:hypothetical protein